MAYLLNAKGNFYLVDQSANSSVQIPLRPHIVPGISVFYYSGKIFYSDAKTNRIYHSQLYSAEEREAVDLFSMYPLLSETKIFSLSSDDEFLLSEDGVLAFRASSFPDKLCFLELTDGKVLQLNLAMTNILDCMFVWRRHVESGYNYFVCMDLDGMLEFVQTPTQPGQKEIKKMRFELRNKYAEPQLDQMFLRFAFTEDHQFLLSVSQVIDEVDTDLLS